MRKLRISALRERFWPTPKDAIEHGPSSLQMPAGNWLLAWADWSDASLTLGFRSHALHVQASSDHEITVGFSDASGAPVNRIVDEDPVLVTSEGGDWILDRERIVRQRMELELKSVSVHETSAQFLFSAGAPLLVTVHNDLDSGKAILIWFDLE